MFVTVKDRALGLTQARALLALLTQASDILTTLPRCDDSGAAYLLMTAASRLGEVSEAIRFYGRELTKVEPANGPRGKAS